MANDTVWDNWQRNYDELVKIRKARALKAKKKRQKKLNQERYLQEANEYQQKFTGQYSKTYTENGQLNEGDASALFEKYNPKNYQEYQDDSARRYGAHNDGYSSTNNSTYSLNRGMGCAPHQTCRIKTTINAHKYDASAPTVRVRLQNSWTQNAENSQSPQQLGPANSTRAFNGGRSNGGTKLGGRF